MILRVLHRSSRATWILWAVLAAGTSSAEPASPSPQFRPAKFGTGPDSLIARLKCPVRWLNPPNAVAYCQARINASGKPVSSYCFVLDAKQDSYRSASESASDGATFVPASVDGRSVEVLFSYRVSFLWDGDTCNFAAIPNWGFNAAASDVKHTAPQEILSDGAGWYDRLQDEESKQHARVDSGKGRVDFSTSIVGKARVGVGLVMSVLVAADGSPSDARLEKNFFTKEHFAQASVRALSGSRFVPGFYEDQPVEMRYYEVLYAGPGN